MVGGTSGLWEWERKFSSDMRDKDIRIVKLSKTNLTLTSSLRLTTRNFDLLGRLMGIQRLVRVKSGYLAIFAELYPIIIQGLGGRVPLLSHSPLFILSLTFVFIACAPRTWSSLSPHSLTGHLQLPYCKVLTLCLTISHLSALLFINSFTFYGPRTTQTGRTSTMC